MDQQHLLERFESMKLIRNQTMLLSLITILFSVASGMLLINLLPWGVFLLAGILVIFLIAIIFVNSGLAIWQILSLLALTGYVVLSYGFANWVFRLGGVPFPIGHLLAFGALLIAL